MTVWGSFIDATGTLQVPPRLAARYTLKNYITVIKGLHPRWIVNTIILTVIGVSLSVIVSTLTGFGLYLHMNKKIIALLIVSTVIPRYAIAIPQFLVIRYMGMQNTLIACALPLVVTPMHILLAKTFFEQFPKSILDAAQLDGLSRFGALFRIILPESKHLLAALGVLKSVELWGDYLWQYIVLSSPGKKTFYLGAVSMMQQSVGSDAFKTNPVGLGLALSVLTLIPFILIFSTGSKYFMYQLGGVE
jgi:ABC-type glycerol-3-phosphate transport system permease component